MRRSELRRIITEMVDDYMTSAADAVMCQMLESYDISTDAAIEIVEHELQQALERYGL